MRAIAIAVSMLCLASSAAAQDPSGRPTPAMVDTPTVKVLKGLNVPAFELEMQLFVQALGVNCGYCHVPRDFASDDKPQKIAARRMIEMVQAINKQFFPDHKPGREESTLGKVTCFTCHQGSAVPKTTIGAH
jgi:photosynthetic reaction center cytochrome c subunit